MRLTATSSKMIRTSAPGKVIISGEYAVLEGRRAIVAAVDRRVHAEIEKSPDSRIHITLADFGISDFTCACTDSIRLSQSDDRRLLFAVHAVNAALSYIGSCTPFKITTYSEIDSVGGKKIGFGSSAAAVVAICDAVLRFHSIKADKAVLYRLSVLAHFLAQGSGSGADVAASAYGGIISYRAPDASWLKKAIETKNVRQIAGMEWPNHAVDALPVPDGMFLSVFFTGECASTREMIAWLIEWKALNRERYNMHIRQLGDVADSLAEAWKKPDSSRIIWLLNRNEEILRELGRDSGLPIETPELRRLNEICMRCFSAGKLSGAGGGDIGIAVSFDRKMAERIRKECLECGLIPVMAGLCPSRK